MITFEEVKKKREELRLRNTLKVINGFEQRIMEKIESSRSQKEYNFWADDDFILFLAWGYYDGRDCIDVFKRNKGGFWFFKNQKLLFRFFSFDSFEKIDNYLIWLEEYNPRKNHAE